MQIIYKRIKMWTAHAAVWLHLITHTSWTEQSHYWVLMMVATFPSRILVVWVTHFPQNTAAPCCQSQDSHHPRSKGSDCFQKQLPVFSVDTFCTTEMPLMIVLLLEALWFTVLLKMDEKKIKNLYNSTIPFRSAGTLILRLVNRKSKKKI